MPKGKIESKAIPELLWSLAAENSIAQPQNQHHPSMLSCIDSQTSCLTYVRPYYILMTSD